MIVVDNKEDLKTALSNRKQTIVVKGKLAKRLRPLSKIKKAPANLNPNISPATGALMIAPLAEIPVAVAITLIITIGVVSIVAILKDYSVKVSGDEVFLVNKD